MNNGNLSLSLFFLSFSLNSLIVKDNRNGLGLVLASTAKEENEEEGSKKRMCKISGAEL